MALEREYDLLCDRLAWSRDMLFDYERIEATGMFHGPEIVIDEMVAEIRKLRKLAKEAD